MDHHVKFMWTCDMYLKAIISSPFKLNILGIVKYIGYELLLLIKTKTSWEIIFSKKL
jgi:hypothetical protein